MCHMAHETPSDGRCKDTDGCMQAIYILFYFSNGISDGHHQKIKVRMNQDKLIKLINLFFIFNIFPKIYFIERKRKRIKMLKQSAITNCLQILAQFKGQFANR